jgi:exocyst complex component 6
MKQWLLEIRNVSAQVGKLALDSMEARTRRWRARREKDHMLRLSRVGSAVEMVTYEKTECKLGDKLTLNIILTYLGADNVLDNDKLKVDFQPLYQCIHIYTTLDSLDELRKSYQADRKVAFLRGFLAKIYITSVT